MKEVLYTLLKRSAGLLHQWEVTWRRASPRSGAVGCESERLVPPQLTCQTCCQLRQELFSLWYAVKGQAPTFLEFQSASDTVSQRSLKDATTLSTQLISMQKLSFVRAYPCPKMALLSLSRCPSRQTNGNHNKHQYQKIPYTPVSECTLSLVGSSTPSRQWAAVTITGGLQDNNAAPQPRQRLSDLWWVLKLVRETLW